MSGQDAFPTCHTYSAEAFFALDTERRAEGMSIDAKPCIVYVTLMTPGKPWEGNDERRARVVISATTTFEELRKLLRRWVVKHCDSPKLRDHEVFATMISLQHFQSGLDQLYESFDAADFECEMRTDIDDEESWQSCHTILRRDQTAALGYRVTQYTREGYNAAKNAEAKKSRAEQSQAEHTGAENDGAEDSEAKDGENEKDWQRFIDAFKEDEAKAVLGQAKAIKAMKDDAKAMKRDAKTLKAEAKTMRDDSRAIREEAKAISAEAKAIREESKAVREETREIREEAWSVKGDAKAIRAETKGIREEAWFLKEDAKAMREEARAIKDVANPIRRRSKSLSVQEAKTATQQPWSRFGGQKVKTAIQQRWSHFGGQEAKTSRTDANKGEKANQRRFTYLGVQEATRAFQGRLSHFLRAGDGDMEHGGS